MRQITAESVFAFNNNLNFSKANMLVVVEGNATKMFLHGNLIARKEGGKLFISNAGWQSNTTKERLNALDGVSIHQKNFVWYLNGEEWDGSWTEIK